MMSQKEQDERYMRRCLEPAVRGLGTTYPNPLVGSVIVYEGRIIGEGFHHHSGGPHAEVVAMQAVGVVLVSVSMFLLTHQHCCHLLLALQLLIPWVHPCPGSLSPYQNQCH